MFVDELKSTPTKKLITNRSFVYRGATIGETVQKMVSENVGVIAILDPETQQFLGLFTKRHLLRRAILQQRGKNEPIDSIFTPNPLALHDTETLERAFVLMYKYDYKYLPVIDEKYFFHGFITAEDFLKFLEELFPEAIGNVLPRNKFTTLDAG